MFPELTAAAYPAIVAAAAVVGATVFCIEARAARLPLGRVLALQALLAFSAHLGGRLYLLMEGEGAWVWPDLLSVGYRHPAAIVALLAALMVFPRLLLPGVPIGRLADCAAPAVAFSLVVMRVGCFGLGCCFGTPSALPWALRFPPGSPASEVHARLGWLTATDRHSLPVHPLQIYFLLLSLGVGLFLIWFRRRKTFDGQVLLVFLAVHETGKFLLEALRQDVTPRGGSPTVPAISLTLALLAAAVLSVQALRGGRASLGGDPQHGTRGQQPVQQHAIPDRAALRGEVR